MRVLITIALAGAAAAGLAACSAPRPLAIQDMPRRKAGLWRQTVNVAGSNAVMPETTACSDAISESKLTLLGQHKSRDLCQSQSFTRDPDGAIGFKISCDMGVRGKTVSTGTISGDFGARYQIAMDTKTTGALIGPPDTERKLTITEIWEGPCATGQRGGDLILADGRKINLTDAAPGAHYR
ncbi:MAG TPA: DUF3617 family protein [Caulobacteraceae bacterium]|jgi:hypothetical protein|nr:DUF3617 family protein [Caulobacteraceae bacterium]